MQAMELLNEGVSAAASALFHNELPLRLLLSKMPENAINFLFWQ